MNGHFRPKTLWHQDMLALVSKCLDTSYLRNTQQETSDLGFNTDKTVQHFSNGCGLVDN